jgi:hypothetical protein
LTFLLSLDEVEVTADSVTEGRGGNSSGTITGKQKNSKRDNRLQERWNKNMSINNTTLNATFQYVLKSSVNPFKPLINP